MGYATVPGTVGPNWQLVRGYGFAIENGPGPAQCLVATANAERVTTGVYRVEAFPQAVGCSTWSVPPPPPAIVSPLGTSALEASYTSACDVTTSGDPTASKMVLEVHLFDTQGVPTDSAFTISWLDYP